MRIHRLKVYTTLKKVKSIMKKERKIDKLNPKIREFIYNYIELGFNATKAYLKTYKNKSYSTAKINSHRLLLKANIKEALQELLDEHWNVKENNISETFKRWQILASADISDYLDDQGNIKVEEFKELNTYPIAQFDKNITDTANGQNIKQSIKLLDKQKALEMISKILGMIQEKIEHSGVVEIIPAVRPKE